MPMPATTSPSKQPAPISSTCRASSADAAAPRRRPGGSPLEEWRRGDARCDRLAAGATIDDFGWRISIAEIASDGPFSRFPGIDRKLAVLEGKVSLTIEGSAPVTLDPHTAALDFHGESAVQADLVNGPSQDLNVMTRRGRFTSRMTRQSAGELNLSASTTIIVALGRLMVAGQEMESLDALLVDGMAQSGLTIGPADFYMIEITGP